MDDECGAGIHVDIFEVDIAVEDEGGIFGNETPLNPVTQPRGMVRPRITDDGDSAASIPVARSFMGEVTFDLLKKAVVYGSVLASYNVEAFSLERLKTVDAAQIEFRSIAFFPVVQKCNRRIADH
jgi:hypothetical protein